jgi:hypothetical protein
MPNCPPISSLGRGIFGRGISRLRREAKGNRGLQQIQPTDSAEEPRLENPLDPTAALI